jgi:hypothetical protein
MKFRDFLHRFPQDAESGVALRLPPHSKTLRVFQAAIFHPRRAEAKRRRIPKARPIVLLHVPVF